MLSYSIPFHAQLIIYQVFYPIKSQSNNPESHPERAGRQSKAEETRGTTDC
jgi:hypothetical protein